MKHDALGDYANVPNTVARGPCKGNIVEAAGTVVVNGIEWLRCVDGGLPLYGAEEDAVDGRAERQV